MAIILTVLASFAIFQTSRAPSQPAGNTVITTLQGSQPAGNIVIATQGGQSGNTVVTSQQ